MNAFNRTYIRRASRYVLRPEDQDVLRFSDLNSHGRHIEARLRDISETGLAFTYRDELVPHVGDLLKIEFTVPGRRQIACFATVHRVEERADWDPELGHIHYKLVGLQFRQLPAAHRRALQLSLQGRANSETDQNMEIQVVDTGHSHLFAFLGLAAAMVPTLIVLVAPPQSWIKAGLRVLQSFLSP